MYKLIIFNNLIMYCCFTDLRKSHVYLISYLPWKQHHFWQVHTQVDKISKSHLVSSWFIDWLINCLFSVERFMARARLGTIGHVENISARLTARTKLGTIRYLGNKQTLATVKGWMFSLPHWEVVDRVVKDNLTTVSSKISQLVFISSCCSLSLAWTSFDILQTKGTHLYPVQMARCAFELFGTNSRCLLFLGDGVVFHLWETSCGSISMLQDFRRNTIHLN